MLGQILLVVFILVETGFFVWSFRKKSNLKREKSIARIALFIIFLLLVFSPIIQWNFSWALLGILLGLQAIFAIISLYRKKENSNIGKTKIVFVFLGRVFLISVVLVPVLLFPQYEPIKTTGQYQVDTEVYTWVDQSREELFTEEADDKRAVTVEFWYPSIEPGQKEIFPLVVFSHGAFGLRSSNYSTFQELASNGYVVASIDHTHHAFMTEQTDGESVIANMDFVNEAMKATNGEIAGGELFNMEQDWIKLRTGDMAFVLDYIKESVASTTENNVFQMIDLEHIGAFGHSLGGATAAQIGRDDGDVDAVIVVDGTMLGEIIDFEDGVEVISDIPYPKPILNFYNESHYEDALEEPNYANTVMHKNAEDSYQVVIKGSGHMNFTDLPLVAPFLANLLGTGNVDARECIETTNGVILEFFNRYLKSSKMEIPREREY